MPEIFFDNKKPMIPIHVALNGRKGMIRVQGILDTGSTFVAIPPEVAETLGYDHEKGEGQVEVSTSNGLESFPFVTLDEVTVMGRTAPRVKATIMPFTDESRINCLVGLTFLRNFAFSVDYTTGELKIE